MQMTKDISDSFKVSKDFAIISVLIAHSTLSSENIYIDALFSRLGAVGVPVFLFSSGFFSNRKNQKTCFSFSKQKCDLFLSRGG